MYKIVSHPYFSSELDNLFPTLSLLVLHFLIISSSSGSKTWLNFHSVVQTTNSNHSPSWLHRAWEERMFSLCCFHPCNSLPSFYPAFSWLWSCLHLPHTLFPRQGFSLLRSSLPEGSLRRIFDRVYLALHCLRHFISKCWFAAGSKGSGRLWISKIWDMSPFPWGCTQFSGLHQNLCELGLELFWLLLPSSDSQYWSRKWKTNAIGTLKMYSLYHFVNKQICSPRTQCDSSIPELQNEGILVLIFQLCTKIVTRCRNAVSLWSQN